MSKTCITLKNLIKKKALLCSSIIACCYPVYAQQNDLQLLSAYEGNPEAQFQLALTYSKQVPNYKLAAYWYKQAARQGMANAQYNLGHFYLQGMGVRQNTNETIKWWQQAAHQNYSPAQHNLGTAYFEGIGVEKNNDLAEQWFLRCEKLGNTACTNSLKIVRAHVTIDDDSTVPTEQTKPLAIKEPLAREKPLAIEEPLAQKKPLAIEKPLVKEKSLTRKEPIAQKQPSIEPNSEIAANEITTNKKIAIHINANPNSTIIAELDNSDEFSVLTNIEGWQQVQLKKPIAIWSYKAFVSIENSTATLTGDKVRARTAPSINNSKVITELSINTQLEVLEETDKWVKLALNDYIAWTPRVSEAIVIANEKLIAATTVVKPVNQAKEVKPNSSIKAPTKLAIQYSFLDRRSDDEWLFSSDPEQFTVLLGNYDNSEDLTEFAQENQLLKHKLAHLLLAKRGNIEWKYVLYGNFNNTEDAIQSIKNNGFKFAFIAKLGNIQEQRCSAWKTTIPSPKNLDKYCLKKTASAL